MGGARPTVRGVSLILAHAPSLVGLGSKPARELGSAAEAAQSLSAHLRSYDAALGYPPNQVFVGNLTPDDLRKWETPWFDRPATGAVRFGPDGEIMPEEELLGLLALADQFELFGLEAGVAERAGEGLAAHPLLAGQIPDLCPRGVAREVLEARVARQGALPLVGAAGRLIGAVLPGHPEDETLTSRVLLENLACKATAALALAHLLARPEAPARSSVRYVLNCGEEAVGDRYQRGGGNLAKAVAEWAGCTRATGADVKAFCCGPMHALMLAGSLVQSGVLDDTLVVAGGSLAKLGMKFQGHLRHQMPILEDVLAGCAIHVGRDDGVSPVIRMDAIGRHEVGSGASPVAIVRALYSEPLREMGLTLLDVDRFSLELHNPEVTEPAGSGNVPLANYRTLASLAVLEGLIARDDMTAFVQARGLPGFSPTQGHIASAVPYLGHARRALTEGTLRRTVFAGKGSLFLGRMTQLADGLSLIIERNPAAG